MSAPRDISASVVTRLRGGDPQAGATLQALYRPRLLGYCQSLLSSEQDAEDAVQEVFCKVLRSREVPDNFRAWVYRVARNHCLNLLRDRARRVTGQPLPPASTLPEPTTGVLSRLARVEAAAELSAQFRGLPASHREPLRLRYFDGLSREEIAFVLDLPESLVKSRLHEGLERLRRSTDGR